MITDLTLASAATLNRDMTASSRHDNLAQGFPPVIGSEPRVLVLGSLPGRASIAAGQYYAMPRNAFWFVMAGVCGAGPDLPYAERLQRLHTAGIALWDVLHAAARPGSLDANIVQATEQPNAVAALIARCTSIRLIAFNGRKAAALFRRHVTLDLVRSDIEFAELPSTSPAHAALDRQTKRDIWRTALLPHLGAG
jgi:hypoxanthine-DNA glycosylase